MSGATIPSDVAGPPTPRIRGVGALTGWGEGIRALPDGAPTGPLVYRVVPIATFKRRTRLTPEESARTERLARIVAMAEALWDERDDARAFLNMPHPLLDGRTPLDVAGTELGARRVERLLQDVDHGLPL